MAEPAMIDYEFGEGAKQQLSPKALKLAKEFEIDVDDLAQNAPGQSLEAALMAKIRQITSEIIAEQNAYIEKHGIPLEELSVRFI